ncbi:MAG: plasmid recombination protein [Lachnospiraceae bacterium]|nr:plasmid recombination protein [Lachnospiraceae bacterium]
MPHLRHSKIGGIPNIEKEYDRDEEWMQRHGFYDDDYNPVSPEYKNGKRVFPDGKHRIRPEETKDNYKMLDTDKSLNTMITDRIAEIYKDKRKPRKDCNVLTDWKVTCPRELLDDPAKVERFFKVVFVFTQMRYGKANVLQGYVHMDETTPHIHIAMMPVTDAPAKTKSKVKMTLDEKNKLKEDRPKPKYTNPGERLSATALFYEGRGTKNHELVKYQDELDKVIAHEFGMPGLVRNNRTKGGYTTEELKARTADLDAIEDGRKDIVGQQVLLDAQAAALDTRGKSYDNIDDIKDDMRNSLTESLKGDSTNIVRPIIGSEHYSAADKLFAQSLALGVRVRKFDRIINDATAVISDNLTAAQEADKKFKAAKSSYAEKVINKGNKMIGADVTMPRAIAKSLRESKFNVHMNLDDIMAEANAGIDDYQLGT